MECNNENCKVKSPLYRNAPKGEVPPNWSCINHVDPEFRPEKDFQRLVSKIHDVGN